MKHIRTLLIFSLLLGIAATAPAQSKKDLREKGISKITVQEYFLEDGMDEPLVESMETYDAKGELTEVQEFSKEGELKRWEKYAYDAEGNLVEEQFLDERGRVERKEVSVYKDGLRVEKKFYNAKGQLVKRKVYEYEYRSQDR